MNIQMFLILAVCLFLMLFVVWSKRFFLNFVIKVCFLGMVIWGILCILHNAGMIDN